MPLKVFELNSSIVWIENADMVVKEPRKPITKNKYMGDKIKNIGTKIFKKTIKELDNIINNELKKT